MVGVRYNERIQDELVWHLSAKESIDKQENGNLWALADGNLRGLKQALNAYFYAEEHQDVILEIQKELDSAVKTHQRDEFIIESDDEDFAKLVSEGYIQGIIRAYTITNGMHSMEGPPQDLSSFKINTLTEVNNETN